MFQTWQVDLWNVWFILEWWCKLYLLYLFQFSRHYTFSYSWHGFCKTFQLATQAIGWSRSSCRYVLVSSAWTTARRTTLHESHRLELSSYLTNCQMVNLFGSLIYDFLCLVNYSMLVKHNNITQYDIVTHGYALLLCYGNRWLLAYWRQWLMFNCQTGTLTCGWLVFLSLSGRYIEHQLPWGVNSLCAAMRWRAICIAASGATLMVQKLHTLFLPIVCQAVLQ